MAATSLPAPPPSAAPATALLVKDDDSSVVSFLHPTLHSEDFAHLLDARGVAVRTGHHCAQPLLNRLGISGTVRASFYIYNTMQDAEEFLMHVRDILERFA